MRIEYFEIKHGCQFKSFSTDFGPGITVITGPNGAGKSNLVSLLMRGLTGSSGLAGRKEEDLKFGETNGHVLVGFKVGQTEGQIKRSLKSASCSMRFGEQTYSSIREIDAALTSILGVSLRVLNEIIMARQGRIEALLFQTPSERKDSLNELFGVGYAEQLREVLTEQMADVVVESREPSIKMMEQQLSQLKEELAKAEHQQMQLGAVLPADRVSYLERVVRNSELQTQALAALQSVEQEVERLTGRLDERRVRINSDLEQSKSNEQLLTELKAPYMTAAARLSQLELQRGYLKKQQELVKIQHERQSLLAKPEPVRPHDPAEILELEQRYSTHVHLLTTSESLVKGIGDSKTCPTCKQDVPPETVAMHQQQVVKLRALTSQEYGQLTRLQQAMAAYERAKQLWEQTQTHGKDELLRCAKELKDLPVIEVLSEAQLAELTELVRDYTVLEKNQVEVKARLAASNEVVQALEQSLAAAQQNLAGLKRQGGVVVDAALAEEAKQALAMHKVCAEESARLKGLLSGLQEQQARAKLQLCRLMDEEKNLRKLREWRDLMSDARDVLHRDRLPNLVAQSYLRALNQRLAKYLEIFGSPFLCTLQPDMSVECKFKNGYRLSADRLSGGEKVMLGISFRFALCDLFAQGLGLLILDEPTVFLDHDRIDAVRELLERVKSYSHATGLQIIITTHESRLAGVADRLISL